MFAINHLQRDKNLSNPNMLDLVVAIHNTAWNVPGHYSVSTWYLPGTYKDRAVLQTD